MPGGRATDLLRSVPRPASALRHSIPKPAGRPSRATRAHQRPPAFRLPSHRSFRTSSVFLRSLLLNTSFHRLAVRHTVRGPEAGPRKLNRGSAGGRIRNATPIAVVDFERQFVPTTGTAHPAF